MTYGLAYDFSDFPRSSLISLTQDSAQHLPHATRFQSFQQFQSFQKVQPLRSVYVGTGSF
jgi:hypothetical protein